ncbi:MAG: DUF4258 domain-containing protein [Pseudomonadota bacterium]
MEKTIQFSKHALGQMDERGISQNEVVEAIRSGEQSPAKKGRLSFRKNFVFEKMWAGRFYRIKQVVPIVIEEKLSLVVVTAFSFYF